MTHPPHDHEPGACAHGHPPLPGVDPEALALFHEYKRSMMLHRRLLASLFAGVEMHPAQAGCLRALAAHDGISQSDLAEILHVSKPTVTTMLQRMETAGTIERRGDDADSRVTRVYITQEGRRLADDLRAHVAQEIGLSFGTLAPADRAELLRLLALVNENVEGALRERGVSAWTHPGHERGCAE